MIYYFHLHKSGLIYLTHFRDKILEMKLDIFILCNLFHVVWFQSWATEIAFRLYGFGQWQGY